MPVNKVLDDNLRMLEKLDKNQYPALYKELHVYGGAMKAKLINVISEFKSKKRQAQISTKGKKLYFSSFRHLVKKYGGSLCTWSSTIHYLVAIGLLEIPELTDKDYNGQAVNYAEHIRLCNHQSKMTTFYHVPAYVPETLAKAENAIQSFKAAGINRTGFTKAAESLGLGQEKADSDYKDKRPISQKEQTAEQIIVDTLKNSIADGGYTTKAVALKAARVQLTKNRVMKKYEAEKRLGRIWRNRNKRILFIAGARYHRPSKREKEKYNLKSNGWIITAE